MAQSQRFQIAGSRGVQAAILVLAFCLFSRFLAAVVLANVLLLGVSYWLISYRKSPVLQRPKIRRFKFLERSAWMQELLQQSMDLLRLENPCVPSLAVSGTLNKLIDLIVANFVDSWYTKVSSNPSFSKSVKLELNAVLSRLHQRLSAVNIPEFLVFRIVPLVTAHYSSFVASENAQDNLYSIESKLATARGLPAGSLHKAVSLTLPGPDARKLEKDHLRRLVELVLRHLLSADEFQSPITRTLVREIVSCTVLASVVEALSEGDLLNQLIVSLILSTLHKRKQVRKLREALEQHTKHAPVLNLPPLTLPLAPDTLHKWEDAVLQCSDECNLRSLALSVETAKSRLLPSCEDTRVDISRLSRLIAKIETALQHNVLALNLVLADPKKKYRFREFLRLSQTEYLLDGWTNIENMKAPLEDASHTSVSLKLGFSSKDEILKIYLLYFRIEGLAISPAIRSAVEAFVFSNLVDPALYNEARLSLLKLQESIYRKLESSYLQFQISDGFADDKLDPQRPSRRASSLQFNKKLGEDSLVSSESSRISPAVVSAVESAFKKIMHSSPNHESRTTFAEAWDEMTAVASGSDSFAENCGRRSSADPNRLSRLFESRNDSDLEETSFDSTDIPGSDLPDDSQLENLEILLAAPGDLKLEEKISTLDKDIETLSEQSKIFVSLIKKSELTNNVSELKILRRSNASLEREISIKELQRQQYIVQESDNSLFGKSRVRIQSCILSSDNHHSYALYIIEVQKFSSEDTSKVVAGWVIARRYSQFYKLNEYLKRRCHVVADIKFPKRTVPYLQFQKMQQIETRKPLLEQYLRELLSLPEVCSDAVFRSFLSSEHFDLDKGAEHSRPSIFNRFYQEFSPNTETLPYSMEDSKSAAHTQAIIQNIQEMERELKQFDDLERAAADRPPFIEPIFDFIFAVFDLGAKNWLRGRALLVILQQVLGSTIEKTIRSAINGAILHEYKTVIAFESLTSMLFPNGRFRDPPKARTRAEQLSTRQEAFSIFTIFMAETTSKIFGAKQASVASSNLLELIQNDYLNKSLLLKTMDAVFAELFPEIDLPV